MASSRSEITIQLRWERRNRSGEYCVQRPPTVLHPQVHKSRRFGPGRWISPGVISRYIVEISLDPPDRDPCAPTLLTRAKAFAPTPLVFSQGAGANEGCSRSRLVQQGLQSDFEVLHLLLDLSPACGCLSGAEGAQAHDLSLELLILFTETGDLGRKPIVLVTSASVLSRKACGFLVGNPSPCNGLIALLLPDLRSVTPDACCDILGSVVHLISRSRSHSLAPRLRQLRYCGSAGFVSVNRDTSLALTHAILVQAFRAAPPFAAA